MLKIKTFAIAQRPVDLLLRQIVVFAMNARENEFDCGLLTWIRLEDTESLVGLEDVTTGKLSTRSYPYDLVFGLRRDMLRFGGWPLLHVYVR